MSGTLLQAVEELARLIGDLGLAHYRAGVARERKQDGTDVSEADRAAERAAREWIRVRFPGDGVVGEEYGETNPGAAQRWFIDPIDGTTSFVRRVPLWGALVGVEERGEMVAGAIYCPAVDEIVVAERGEGCWWNGAAARVSDVERLEDALVSTTSERIGTGSSALSSRWNSLREESRMSRGWGDCYGYLLVATGRAEVMMDPVVAAWDVAPMLPIFAEAGGVFTDLRGEATAFGGSAIATNGKLARSARKRLGVPSDA